MEKKIDKEKINKINKYIDRSIHEIEGDQFSFMLV